MERLKKVLESKAVIDDLKGELIRWSYEVDSKVIPYESFGKYDSFYITINGDCDIWVSAKDIPQQVRAAEIMKFILDNSDKLSLAEVIEKIEEYEGEECREYREIAEALDEDIAPYGEIKGEWKKGLFPVIVGGENEGDEYLQQYIYGTNEKEKLLDILDEFKKSHTGKYWIEFQEGMF